MEAVRVVIASNVGLAAGPRMTRYCIDGVHVVEGQDGVWAVATDGRSLVCVPAKVQGEFGEAHEMIVPSEAFVGAECKKVKKGVRTRVNTLDLHDGSAEWWSSPIGVSIKPASRGVVDANDDGVTFPPYEECFGAEMDRVWVGLNAKMLRTLCKAIADVTAPDEEVVTLGVVPGQDGKVSQHCIAVLGNGPGVAVLMPVFTNIEDCKGEYARRAKACARKRPPVDPTKKAAPKPEPKPDPMDAVVGPSIAGAVVAVAMEKAAAAAQPA